MNICLLSLILIQVRKEYVLSNCLLESLHRFVILGDNLKNTSLQLTMTFQ